MLKMRIVTEPFSQRLKRSIVLGFDWGFGVSIVQEFD